MLRNKFYAIILGTVGIGIASQLLSFSSLIFTLGAAGISLGLTKYVSEWEKEGNWSEIRDTMAKFLVFSFSLGLIFLFLTIMFSRQISTMLLDSDSYTSFLILTAVSFPFAAATTIFDASIRGLKEFSKYVKISVITSLVSLGISVFAVIEWGLPGLPLSIVIPSVITLALFMYLFWKNNYFSLKDLRLFNFQISDSLKMILKIGAASLFDLVLHQVTLIIIRSTLIRHLGISANGIYQVVFAISNNYLNLLLMSLFVYVLPILSEMKEIDEINNELNNTLKFTLFIVFPIISLTFVLREYVIMILYTSKFVEASDYLIYNFIGDYIRAISWVLSAWLIPRSKLKLWLSLGIIFNITFFSVFYLLINFLVLDIRSIVIAYAFANVMHLIVNMYITRKVIKFKFRTDVFRLLVITSSCLAAVFAISLINIIWGYVAIIPLFAIWLKTCVKKEDVIKLLQMTGLKFLTKSK
jgi:PST family polysaccharide transporter